MDRSLDSPHQLVNPDTLAQPSGFSHAVVAQAGRTVYLAGQVAQAPDGRITGNTISEQFSQAAGNVVTALEAAGAHVQDLVSMQIFTTDLAGYLAALKAAGEAYRRHFGKHFVATALIEVKGLVGGAKVELMCVAVVPDRPG
jgi:enamine deaminase RidA (YjgF/YER057c/UK114 family)